MQRRSKAVRLLLCCSVATLFATYNIGCDEGRKDDPNDPYWEPSMVYVGGVPGVYHPVTGAFVPRTSPNYSSAVSGIRSIARSGATHTPAGHSISGTSRGGFGSVGASHSGSGT